MSEFKLFDKVDALQNAYRFYVDGENDSRVNHFVKWASEQYNLEFKFKEGKFFVRGDEKNIMMFMIKWS